VEHGALTLQRARGERLFRSRGTVATGSSAAIVAFSVAVAVAVAVVVTSSELGTFADDPKQSVRAAQSPKDIETECGQSR